LANNRIFDNGGFYFHMVADGGMWPDDGVADFAILADTHRMDDDGVVKFGEIAGSIAFVVEQKGIGFKQGFLFAAIEPLVHGNSRKWDALFNHAHEAVGEWEFAIGANVIFYIVAERFYKRIHLPDHV